MYQKRFLGVRAFDELTQSVDLQTARSLAAHVGCREGERYIWTKKGDLRSARTNTTRISGTAPQCNKKKGDERTLWYKLNANLQCLKIYFCLALTLKYEYNALN